MRAPGIGTLAQDFSDFRATFDLEWRAALEVAKGQEISRSALAIRVPHPGLPHSIEARSTQTLKKCTPSADNLGQERVLLERRFALALPSRQVRQRAGGVFIRCLGDVVTAK